MKGIVASCLFAAVALAGCASAPQDAAIVAAATTCSELGAQIAGTEDTRRSAAEKQQGAWKAVVPFAVAARYASGKSAVDEADEQLAALRAESARQGCVRHGE